MRGRELTCSHLMPSRKAWRPLAATARTATGLTVKSTEPVVASNTVAAIPKAAAVMAMAAPAAPVMPMIAAVPAPAAVRTCRPAR